MQLTITTFLSVDGVMQGPGGQDEDRSDGFDRGGWLVPHFDEATGQFMTEVFDKADAFLLGRRTYEIFAAYWPKVTDPDDPIANPLNTLPKYVVSTRLRSADWQNSKMLENDLVDEWRLLVFPVIVGAGRRLFPDLGVATGLRLVDARTTGSGTAIHVYQPTGRPEFGEVDPPPGA